MKLNYINNFQREGIGWGGSEQPKEPAQSQQVGVHLDTEQITALQSQLSDQKERIEALTRELESARGQAWDAAIILANNYCVQISDKYNNDDDVERADVATECAKIIRAEIGQSGYYLSQFNHTEK